MSTAWTVASWAITIWLLVHVIWRGRMDEWVAAMLVGSASTSLAYGRPAHAVITLTVAAVGWWRSNERTVRR